MIGALGGEEEEKSEQAQVVAETCKQEKEHRNKKATREKTEEKNGKLNDGIEEIDIG